MKNKIILEKAAYDVAIQSSKPPLIFEVPIEQGRKELEDAQNSMVFKYPAKIYEKSIDTRCHGCINVYTVVPNILKNRNIVANMNTLTVGGDSVGGNMAIAMALMAKSQKGQKIHKQLLYYPVTDDNFNTNSYLEFANGYYLYRDGMKWFWKQYEPNIQKRNSILATPLKATVEQLKNVR